MFDWIAFKCQTFSYNYAWNDYSKFLNSVPSKLAIAFPIIGYAIFFNDYMAGRLDFSSLTAQAKTHVLLGTEAKLRFAFIGLMLIALSNVLYKILRPKIMRFGESQLEFNQNVDDLFTFGQIRDFHLQIMNSSYDPWTPDGKYYHEEWEAFENDCVWEGLGQGERRINRTVFETEMSKRSFSEAKKRHASLVRSILRETYFRECRQKRLSLSICLSFALTGYFLVLSPSVDLTFAVLLDTFSGI